MKTFKTAMSKINNKQRQIELKELIFNKQCEISFLKGNINKYKRELKKLSDK